MKRTGVIRLLLGLLSVMLAWGIYAAAVILGAPWILWVYVGLCAASAIVYVALTRGYLTRMPKEPPPLWRADAYAAYRERVEGTRSRIRALPYIFLGTAASLLLDTINIFFFDGRFL